MKVLDPQSALLTTSEVHRFVANNPPRAPQRKIGSYQPVNLKNYERVRQDIQHYVTTTVPYTETLPPPEVFVNAVVPKLRSFGLTKTEILVLINLGVGLPRSQSSQPATEADGGEIEGDPEDSEPPPGEEEQEIDDRQLLSLVIEELDERFAGDQGEAKIEKILQTMRTEFSRAQTTAAANGANGTTSV